MQNDNDIETVLSIIINILLTTFPDRFHKNEIIPNTDIDKDLGLDSMDTMLFLSEIENRFKIDIFSSALQSGDYKKLKSIASLIAGGYDEK